MASVRLTRRITSTCQSPPLPRAAGSDCARNGSSRAKVFAAFAAAHVSPSDRRDRRRGGRQRLTRWRGARAGIISVTSSLRPFAPIVREDKAGVCRRAREMPNGRLLVDSPSDWDHNLGLRAQIETVANDADTANAGDGSVSARPCRHGNRRRLRPRSHRGTSAADTAMTPSRPGMGACARSWPH